MKTNNRAIADLVSALKNTRKDTWQYLEVKQLGEILARHRARLRAVIREYRGLKKAIAAETDAIEKLYMGYEAMFQRDHLRDAVRLYVLVNHDYHDAFSTYMADTKKPAANFVPVPAELLSSKTDAMRPGNSKAA